MAFSFWWFTLRVTDADVGSLDEHFEHARAAAALETDKVAIVERWRSEPDRVFEPHAVSEDGVPFAARFNWALRRDAYTELGARLMKSELPGVALRISKESTIDFLNHRHCTPAAVLFAALGPEASAALPGDLGNMLLPATEVGAGLEKVEAVMQSRRFDELVERAGRYLDVAGERDDAQIRRLLSMLEDGVRRALEDGTGLLSIGMPER